MRPSNIRGSKRRAEICQRKHRLAAAPGEIGVVDGDGDGDEDGDGSDSSDGSDSAASDGSILQRPDHPRHYHRTHLHLHLRHHRRRHLHLHSKPIKDLWSPL